MEFEHESGFGFEKLNFNGMLNRLSELIYYANKKKGFYESESRLPEPTHSAPTGLRSFLAFAAPFLVR